MIGQTAPTTQVDQFVERIKDLQRRVADLERVAGRVTGVPIYLTAAARDAVIIAPTAGMLAFLRTPAQLTIFDVTWKVV